MKRKARALLLAACSLLALAAQAQVAPQTILKELRAPDKTRWEVRIQRGKNRAEAPRPEVAAQGRKVHTMLVGESAEKDGDMYRFIRHFSDGTSEEFWILPQMQFYRTSQTGAVMRVLPGGTMPVSPTEGNVSNPMQTTPGGTKPAAPAESDVSDPMRLLPCDPKTVDLAESDFPELYWAAGQPSQLQEIKGIKYLVVEVDGSKLRPSLRLQAEMKRMHRLSGAEKAEPAAAEAARPIRLLLDPQTRLPVSFETPEEIRTYKFAPSPGLKGAMPEAFAAAISLWKKQFGEAIRPPSPP